MARARQRLQTADTAAAQLIRLRLTRAHGALNPLLAHLTQLSPLKILERGYAIVTNERGRHRETAGGRAAGLEG